jgi:hypothetical protein
MRPVWRSPIISALRPLERFWGEALQRPVAWAAEYSYNASPSAQRAWDALVASKLGAPHISPLPEGEIHVRPRRMTWCRRAAVIYTA